MIEDQVVTLKNEQYVLRIDEDLPPERCWSWYQQRNYTTPSSIDQKKLERLFITQHAPAMKEKLEDRYYQKFAKILRSMGANDDEIARCDLTYNEMSQEQILQALPEIIHKSRHTCTNSGCSPFNCPELRDYVFSEDQEHIFDSLQSIVLGDGPFSDNDLQKFLETRRVEVVDSDSQTDLVIVGREGWEDLIDEIIDNHVGKKLRIYSQEMFLSALMSGIDPLEADEYVLYAFRHDHKALEYISGGWPDWVQTYVRPDRCISSNSSVSKFDVKESPLKALGYSVGNSGLADEERHRILQRAFEGTLPVTGPREYMARWGKPRTGQRLYQMASFIANLANTRQTQQNMEFAVQDWSDDLNWLKHTFYRGHISFSWPKIQIS